MRDEDRKASRSPASDLNEFNRKAIEKNMVGIRSVRGNTSNTENSVSPSDLSKAQEKFAQKLEKRNQSPNQYRQSTLARSATQTKDRDSSETGYERLSQKEYSNGTPRNRKVTAGKPDSKISYTAAFCLVGVAIIIDLMQFLIGIIPIVGQIIGVLITFIATFSFWLWFKLLGVPFDRKQSLRFLGGSIIEFIPILGMLPAWTVVVILMLSKEKFGKNLPVSLKK